jgi:hypothetical protein
VRGIRSDIWKQVVATELLQLGVEDFGAVRKLYGDISTIDIYDGMGIIAIVIEILAG